MSINQKGLEDKVEAYCTFSENTILFPVLQDTTEAGVWAAFDAVKDDVALLDMRDGEPGTVEKIFTGEEKLSIYTDEDAALLKQTIDDLLAQ